MFLVSPRPRLGESQRPILGVGRAVFLIAASAVAAAAPLRAQFVVPVSYTMTTPQGTPDGGSYNYYDDTTTQLIDGVFGGNIWSDDLDGPGPHANAYEWVAWVNVEPTLTFNFSSTVSIQSVTLGFSRGSSGGVYLPGSVTIAGQTFTLTGNEFADNLRQDLTFTLTSAFVGSALTISLSDGNNSSWIFLDEAQFTAVPEPAAVWLIALAGGATAWLRRRQNRRTSPAAA